MYLGYFKNSFCKSWTGSILLRQFAVDSSPVLLQWEKMPKFSHALENTCWSEIKTAAYRGCWSREQSEEGAAFWTDMCITAYRKKWKMMEDGSVSQFSHSVVSKSLRPHESQHTRPPSPSAIPGVYPNSCPLSQWYHPTVSSSVIPLSCPQSFPASGSLKWVSPLHQVAKVLEFQLQHQSFQWTLRTDLL